MKVFFLSFFYSRPLLFYLANEYHIAPAKHLVNFKDLNQILRVEIFLHRDGQLRASHVILGYKPFTKRFQSPKNVIKVRDPRLALIDVVVPGFLLSEPPPKGTQDAQLLAPLAAKLLYSQEPLIPSKHKAKKSTPEPAHQEVIDKDLEVFYQQEDLEDAPSTLCKCLKPTQVSANQEAINIPEGMGFEEKTLDLLALLTAHARGSSPTVPVVTRAPTPTPIHTSFMDTAEKKRKRAQWGKGTNGVEEGEVS